MDVGVTQEEEVVCETTLNGSRLHKLSHIRDIFCHLQQLD